MSENKQVFGKPGMSKVEAYGWKIKDQPGEFMLIPKDQLNIDPVYQRDNINNPRVLQISQEWSWAACLALGVAIREDATYWVFDGQHRKLAADKREDIQDLPCLVFEVEGVKAEASAFLSANTVRGPVSMYHKFRAMLAAGDPVAKAIDTMVKGSGYKVSYITQKKCVNCVAALVSEFKNDREAAEKVWRLCVQIFDGDPVHHQVYSGLCYLERHLKKHSMGSVSDATASNALIKAGSDKIRQKITASALHFGKGGARVWAEGIVGLINSKRRGRRIPSLFNAEANGTVEE